MAGSSLSDPMAGQGKAVCSWSPAMPKSHWGMAGGPRLVLVPVPGWVGEPWAGQGQGGASVPLGPGQAENHKEK